MLRVHVHPGARRQAVHGWREDGSLKLEVLAPPEGGRANEAVARVLSDVLGVGRGQVTVIRGRSSRAKVVAVDGLSDGQIRQRIERALAERGDHGQ